MGYDLLRLSSKNVHLGTEPGAFCHCVPGLHARVRPERIGGLIDCHFPLHDGAGGLHVPGRALDGFLAGGSGGDIDGFTALQDMAEMLADIEGRRSGPRCPAGVGEF